MSGVKRGLHIWWLLLLCDLWLMLLNPFRIFFSALGAPILLVILILSSRQFQNRIINIGMELIAKKLQRPEPPRLWIQLARLYTPEEWTEFTR